MHVRILTGGVLLLCCACAGLAGGPLSEHWWRTYNAASNHADDAASVALTPDGGVIVAGESFNPLLVGSDVSLVCYDRFGQRLWDRSYHAEPAGARTGALAVDTAGNAIVCGYAWSGTAQEVIVVKFSASGTFLWERRLESPTRCTFGPGNLLAALALDHADNVYVSGMVGCAMGVRKFSPTGEVQWTALARTGTGAGEGGIPQDITVDDAGNVLMVGLGNGPLGGHVTVRMSPTGVVLWERNEISVDLRAPLGTPRVFAAPDGGVIVVASPESSFGEPHAGVWKYSSAGVRQWVTFFPDPVAEPLDDVEVTGADVLPDGSVVLAGYALSPTRCRVAKISADGQRLWNQTIWNSLGITTSIRADGARILAAFKAANRLRVAKLSATGDPLGTPATAQTVTVAVGGGLEQLVVDPRGGAYAIATRFSPATNDDLFVARFSQGAGGDLNCDGAANFGDIDAFVLAILGLSGYREALPGCDWFNGDLDRSGAVDFGDIDEFVTCLASGGCG